MRRIWLDWLMALSAATGGVACAGDDSCHLPCPYPYGGMAITVRDRTSDVPITGVTVTFTGPTSGELECSPSSNEVRCDWFGVDPESGDYTFTVTAPGYGSDTLHSHATVTHHECGCATGTLSSSLAVLFPLPGSDVLCEEPLAIAATGCLSDKSGKVEFDDLSMDAPTSVTVTALDAGDSPPGLCRLAGDAFRELVLRADDEREWRYFVTLPELPADVVKEGEILDLFASTRPGIFSKFDQAVLLARSGELVLFTVDGGFFGHGLDLSPYGGSYLASEAYCAYPPQDVCSGSVTFQERELLVTYNDETARIRAGQTKHVGGLSVSVDENYTSQGSNTCDPPPGATRYGGFLMGD